MASLQEKELKLSRESASLIESLKKQIEEEKINKKVIEEEAKTISGEISKVYLVTPCLFSTYNEIANSFLCKEEKFNPKLKKWKDNTELKLEK